jgi:KDO2-lipid IV(A) lauroyltransferase
MDNVLYYLALGFVKALQSFPLRWVAQIGRAGGAIAYAIDKRHRKVALQNLSASFGAEKSPEEIEAIAKENFKRLGENYCSAIKTSAMSMERLRPHLEAKGGEVLAEAYRKNPNQKWVIAIGHFGNFELYARFSDFMPGVQMATTYRGLRQPSLNRLMQDLRNRSGCLFFERRSEGAALRNEMAKDQPILVGFLTDQHAGNGGHWGPFFGKECSTTTAPAVFALRYNCPLYTGFVFRTGLASWRMELGDKIPTEESGTPRSSEAITEDINRSFEKAIRKDPANWFWVHKRWKPRPVAQMKPAPSPHAA